MISQTSKKIQKTRHKKCQKKRHEMTENLGMQRYACQEVSRSRYKGRRVDALALRADERRDKLR